MMKMKWYDWTVYIILVISGINLGLTAFDFNIVDKLENLLFSQAQFITKAYFTTIIYFIFGLAGVYGIYLGIKLSDINK